MSGGSIKASSNKYPAVYCAKEIAVTGVTRLEATRTDNGSCPLWAVEKLTIGSAVTITTPAGGKVGTGTDSGGNAFQTVLSSSGGYVTNVVLEKVVKVSGITLSPATLSMTAGQSQQLGATVTPSDANNKALAWSSSNPKVATVDANGKVKAVAAGTAKITATAKDGTGISASCTVTVTAGSSGGGATRVSGTWKKTNGKWWFEYSGGGYPKNKWELIGGKWYHFDAKGYMQTGWIKDGGKWYYLDSSGAMRTGWVKVGGKWYYMNSSGAMQTGWQKIGGKWYYMNSSGVMQTGWQKIGSKWYYMDSSGVMLANTSRTIGGKVYKFDANGVCTNP